MKQLLVALLVLVSLSIQGKSFVTHCTVTTYNAVKSQTNGDPTKTADGTEIDLKKVKSGKQRIVAVSRDLLWCLPHGSVIDIEGYGRYVVADTMNERFTHCIDILIPDNKHFKKSRVKVELVTKGPDELPKYNKSNQKH